jgi:hypothetical protein
MFFRSRKPLDGVHTLDFVDTVPDDRWLQSMVGDESAWVGVESAHPFTWLADEPAQRGTATQQLSKQAA